MMHFNEESLKDLAHSCKIDCSKEELQKLLSNLESILDHVDHLNSVNTENVPPCRHVSGNSQLFLAPDEEDHLLNHDDFMKNVPSKVGGMVKVPTILKS
jgi:aspartyl-tRNA(Asn)/glutamyl-tRNA(Gln) amidotransferase subunit C